LPQSTDPGGKKGKKSRRLDFRQGGPPRKGGDHIILAFSPRVGKSEGKGRRLFSATRGEGGRHSGRRPGGRKEVRSVLYSASVKRKRVLCLKKKKGTGRRPPGSKEENLLRHRRGDVPKKKRTRTCQIYRKEKALPLYELAAKKPPPLLFPRVPNPLRGNGCVADIFYVPLMAGEGGNKRTCYLLFRRALLLPCNEGER